MRAMNVTTFERGYAKGFEIGFQVGIEMVREEEVLNERYEILQDLLEIKFGSPGTVFFASLPKNLDIARIGELRLKLKSVQSIEELEEFYLQGNSSQ